jgi:hypothetical protein
LIVCVRTAASQGVGADRRASGRASCVCQWVAATAAFREVIENVRAGSA